MDDDLKAQLANAVALEARRATEPLIEANAVINGVCPDCLAAEVYGRLHLGSVLHHRHHFPDDASFIAQMAENLSEVLRLKLQDPNVREHLGLEQLHDADIVPFPGNGRVH